MSLAESSAIPFGKYVLLERIAAGGMAEIYRARLTGAAGVTKPVVIKKILPHYAGNPNFISMFVNEAKIVVGLSHGNIAQVFDFGEVDGEYFLAMEYVYGQPLSKVLKRARTLDIPFLPESFATYIAMELSKGLHYAHTRLDEQGRPLRIVHRDVSPQNVILSYEGQVKIVDFGIAKARTAGRHETQAGAMKGKYVYFAPEQARGKELDARTDVFATGIVLYEMVCGRLPFEGKMIEVLSRIVRGEFPRPRELNPAISPDLEDILLTAMAQERNQRYASADAMRAALAKHLAGIAPTFAASSLSQLMAYFFEGELRADGRPLQLPREFLEQAASWRRTTHRSQPRVGTEVLAAESAGRVVASNPTATRRTRVKHLQRVLFWGAPVAAVLAAGLIAVLGNHFSKFSVELTSDPPGATVQVDGQVASTRTPLRISDLSAQQPHRIEVRLPGHAPWVRDVSPKGGAVLKLHAELETAEAPSP